MAYTPNNTNGQKTMANSAPVVIASDQSAVPATLNAETTKVIGVVRNADGSGNLLTSTTNALDVNLKSGSIANTSFIATQATAANLNATVVGNGTFVTQSTLAAETTKVIGTVNIAAAQTLATVTAVTAITNALPVGTNVIGKVSIDQTTPGTTNNVAVTPPTLTKATQGATGFSTQALNDAGRNTRVFMLDAFTAAPLLEAMSTVVQWYGNAAVAGTATPTVVPAAKTLRLTSWKIMYQSLATVGLGVVRIRVNTGGVAALTSPLVASFEAGTIAGATTVAETGVLSAVTGDFPDGLELPAGSGVGFSIAGYGPTGALTLAGNIRFQVFGYEY